MGLWITAQQNSLKLNRWMHLKDWIRPSSFLVCLSYTCWQRVARCIWTIYRVNLLGILETRVTMLILYEPIEEASWISKLEGMPAHLNSHSCPFPFLTNSGTSLVRLCEAKFHFHFTRAKVAFLQRVLQPSSKNTPTETWEHHPTPSRNSLHISFQN